MVRRGGRGDLPFVDCDLQHPEDTLSLASSGPLGGIAGPVGGNRSDGFSIIHLLGTPHRIEQLGYPVTTVTEQVEPVAVTR